MQMNSPQIRYVYVPVKKKVLQSKSKLFTILFTDNDDKIIELHCP